MRRGLVTSGILEEKKTGVLKRGLLCIEAAATLCFSQRAAIEQIQL